jgi:hypothetical protein
MKLETTTRGSQISDYLPTKEALFKCFAIATTLKSANYLCENVTAIYQRKKLSEEERKVADDIIQVAQDYQEYVALEREDRPNAWFEQTILTDFQNLHKNMAKSAIKSISNDVDNSVKMDIAIGEHADMLRAFSVDANSSTPQQAQMLDKVFNAWLVKDNLICKNSVIYKGTPKGEIQIDNKGQFIRAGAKDIYTRLLDNIEGFQSYFNQLSYKTNKKKLTAIIQLHAYSKQPVDVSKPTSSVPIDVPAASPVKDMDITNKSTITPNT